MPSYKAVFLGLACIAAIVLVTQQQNEQPAVADHLVGPAQSTKSWNACLKRLSRPQRKTPNPQSLLNDYPISADAFMYGDSETLTRKDISSQPRALTMLSTVAEAAENSHKSLVLGSKAHLILSNNAVVTADIPSCTIVSVHLPQKNGDFHRDVRAFITKNQQLVKEDRKRKPSPTPRPTYRPNVPCNMDGKPRGCKRRIKPWNQIKNHRACKNSRTFVNKHSRQCESFSDRDRIRRNLCNSREYCVKFNGRDRKPYGIIMKAGESWGKNPKNGANYDCQGRCGPGCGKKSICSNWSRLCMLHDVCSWWFGAGGGPFSKNCGGDYLVASKDYLNCCWRICPAKCKGPSGRTVGC